MIMRKFDITKKETVFFQIQKNQAFGKATRWPLLLLLLLIVIAGKAQAQLQLPTLSLSYSTPQTYKQGTAIASLVPTADGVASFGYSSTVVTLPINNANYPYGLAFDSNGNLFVALSNSTSPLQEYHGGAGTPVAYGPAIKSAGAMTIDAANNIYVVAGLTSVYKIPSGGGSIIDRKSVV